MQINDSQREGERERERFTRVCDRCTKCVCVCVGAHCTHKITVGERENEREVERGTERSCTIHED